MALSDNYQPDKNIGNGVTTVFTGNWSPLNSSYMRVFLESVSTGIQTLVNQGAGASEYTLTFNDSGYSVTMNTAPSSSFYVLRAREVDVDQTNPFTTSRGWQGESVEDSLDKLTAIAQQFQDELSRSIKFQLGSTSTAVLPEPSDAKVLGWDGTDLVNLTPNTSAYLSVTPFILTLLNDSSASEARTTLSAAASGSNSDITALTGSITSIAGNFTAAGRSAFLATVGSTINNVTGNGTDYTVIFGTEIADRLSEYNPATGIFTAQKAGLYQLNFSISFIAITGSTRVVIDLITSNRIYALYDSSGNNRNASNNLIESGSMLCDFDAGDTAYIRVSVTGVGADTSDIGIGSFFSGSFYG